MTETQFALGIVWYVMMAIGVGKAIHNGYGETDMVAVVGGGAMWPIVCVAWAIWG